MWWVSVLIWVMIEITTHQCCVVVPSVIHGFIAYFRIIRSFFVQFGAFPVVCKVSNWPTFMLLFELNGVTFIAIIFVGLFFLTLIPEKKQIDAINTVISLYWWFNLAWDEMLENANFIASVWLNLTLYFCLSSHSGLVLEICPYANCELCRKHQNILVLFQHYYGISQAGCFIFYVLLWFISAYGRKSKSKTFWPQYSDILIFI